MNLLDAYMDDCVLLVQTSTPDGQGGHTVSYTDGTQFIASFEYESAPEAVIAEKQGVGRLYRAYIDKAIDLDFHAVFRRESDGQIFRITNPGKDRHTPPSSMLNKRLIEVEKWELPYETGVSV